MSILQRFWGRIPVSPKSQGLKIFFAFSKRLLHCGARYFPLLPTWRASLHRWRGAHIGKNVFMGAEVFIDDAEPELVTIEDDVTIIARSTILGHAYYPTHFTSLLKDARERRGTVIKRGAYLGAHTVVLPGVTIGEYSIIGACSLITKDVPAYSMVAGVPATVIKKFDKNELDL